MFSFFQHWHLPYIILVLYKVFFCQSKAAYLRFFEDISNEKIKVCAGYLFCLAEALTLACVSFHWELGCFLLSDYCMYFSVTWNTFVIELINSLCNFKSIQENVVETTTGGREIHISNLCIQVVTIKQSILQRGYVVKKPRPCKEGTSIFHVPLRDADDI